MFHEEDYENTIPHLEVVKENLERKVNSLTEAEKSLIEKQINAINVAIEATSKQISICPIILTLDKAKCPKCHVKFKYNGTEIDKYCSVCGYLLKYQKREQHENN